MTKSAKDKRICISILLAFLFFITSNFIPAENLKTGKISGSIYAEDGNTPFPGVIVKVMNVSTGELIESEATDTEGQFKIENLDEGIYLLGVSTPQGNFNANGLLGIKPEKEENVVITLHPYDKETAEAVQEVYREQKREEGESLVGRVISYYPQKNEADVFIIKGYLEEGNRVHVKTPEESKSRNDMTDFYQDVTSLKKEGKKIKMAFASETVLMTMRYPVQVGDLVYLVCKEGILPIFLSPLGIAAIIGAGIIYGTVTLDDEPPTTTQFKK